MNLAAKASMFLPSATPVTLEARAANCFFPPAAATASAATPAPSRETEAS